MKSRFGLTVLMAIGLLPCSLAQEDFIDLKLPPPAKEYCHLVRFSQGWKAEHFDDPPAYPGIDYYYSDYEFRVEGLLGTRFLVGAFTPNSNRRVNSTNHYRVNLSDPRAQVRSAGKSDWDAATVLPLTRKSISPKLVGYQPSFAPFQRYTMSGAQPSYPGSDSRLSPDSAWLVLQSVTPGTVRSLVSHDAVFFDVFNTATGKKVFTIQASYSGLGNDPYGCLERTAWLTERYFIIPLGKHRERCVVCEFAARREPGGKP
jgi:hypothetical protein